MTQYEYLRTIQNLDRFDFWHLLKALLPRGPIWRIPQPNEQDIKPSSIVSEESWGNFIVSAGDIYVSINSIASGENWGTPNVKRQLFVNPIGIGSQEGFGAHTITGQWLIYDDFESALNAGWDTEFKTNWTQLTESSEGIAQRGSNGLDRMYPQSGQLLTGDFLIEFGFWRSASESGNVSIHAELFNSSNTLRVDVVKNGSTIMDGTGSFSISAGPVEQRMRIKRESGVIWVYSWNGSSWVRADSWSTPGTSIANSETLYIKADGADGNGGFTYFGVQGTLI